MSIRIEIFDGTTPMLEKIQLLSHGMALECLSVAGNILQKNARNVMKRKQHRWHHLVVDGKRRIRLGNMRELGLRISHSTGSILNPDSMSRMITSYLNEKAMVVTVGGKHKSFTPNKRENGVVTGKLGRVPSVDKRTHGILHKLNFGGTLDEQLPYYERTKANSMPMFKNAKYVGYNFMQDGYNESKGAIVEAMTDRYSRLLHKAVNTANIQIKTRVAG